MLVELSQAPYASGDRIDEAGQVERGKCDQVTPCDAVTDPAVDWIRLVFAEADDVRFRLGTRQAASPSRDFGEQHHRAQPQFYSFVETPAPQVGKQRGGRYETTADPTGPESQTARCRGSP